MSIWELIIDWFYHLLGYRRVTATSILRTSSGYSPILNAPVTLSYAIPDQKFQQNGTGTTDSSGTAQESVYLKHGIYNFKVGFSGIAGQYGPSTAEKDNVVV
jgi:hypothetical protein